MGKRRTGLAKSLVSAMSSTAPRTPSEAQAVRDRKEAATYPRELTVRYHADEEEAGVIPDGYFSAARSLNEIDARNGDLVATYALVRVGRYEYTATTRLTPIRARTPKKKRSARG